MSAIRLPGPDGIRLVPMDEGMTPFVHRSPFALYAVTLGDMAPRPIVSKATTPERRAQMADWKRRQQHAEASKRYRDRKR